MPLSDEPHDEALKRLNERLDTFTASRDKKTAYEGAHAANDGYRLLAELIGGVLGGLGLGWGLDRIAHTSPWGMIGGLLIGGGLSVYVIVRQAGAMDAKTSAEAGPVHPVASGDEDDT